MSGLADSKHDPTHVDNEKIGEKDAHHQAEVLDDKDLMVDAFAAENREHEMTLWEAVKDHPMACFWAFVFCFTIVSSVGVHFLKLC
jgi:SP family general alpha glucoside:H+ symporter-like MFS transporter